MNPRKPLTRAQELKISSIWLENWHKKSVPSMQQAWYSVILDFLMYEGAIIMTDEIFMLEQTVIDKGLSEEYIQALLSITSPSETELLEDADKLVIMSQATPADREKALRFVLAV